MKKVFALVLAVSLVMGLAAGAMAAPGQITGNAESTFNGNVVVAYDAEDVINVTVSWEDPEITYIWNEASGTWNPATTLDMNKVVFSIDNKSSFAEAVMSVGASATYGVFVTGASFGGTTINPATNNGTDTLTLELADGLLYTARPVGAAAQTIPVVLTISNP